MNNLLDEGLVQDTLVSLDNVCDVLREMLSVEYINDHQVIMASWWYNNLEHFLNDFCNELKSRL